jgi:hypothetical protein
LKAPAEAANGAHPAHRRHAVSTAGSSSRRAFETGMPVSKALLSGQLSGGQ